jgi:Ni/Co efflux regulator RcnB
MKTTLLSATALALILSVPAFAAPHDHGDAHDQGTPAAATPDTGGHGGGGHTGGGGHADHGSHTPAAAPIVAPAGGGMGGGTHHGHTNGGTPGGTPAMAPTGGGMMGGTHRGHTNGGSNTGGAVNNPFNGRGGATRTHAGRGHNSAFDAFRRAFNAPRHYHHGTYHRPSGYYAHRWTLGEFLPALFFAQNYWIDDYSDFDLGNPPDGTHWVRYGNDALLIDEDSGEVIQVVYGIFY